MDAPKIGINVLEHPDEVSKFWDWLTHRPKGYVACDIETGSNPPGSELQIYKPGFHTRMVQFGDAEGGWAIPFQEWKGLVKGAFDWISQSRTTHVWHNGFNFDAQALAIEGIHLDPTCMQDTQVYAGLIGFAGESKRLKMLSKREIGDWTVAGAHVLDTAKKNAGWTWTDIPMGWKPYPMYGVMDTVIDALLYEKWEKERKQFEVQHDMEIAASVITNQMSRTGLTVDGQYLHDAIIEAAREEEELVAQSKAMGWGQPSQDAVVRKILKEAGVLDLTRRTDGGMVSIDKAQLRNVDHPLARLRLRYQLIHRMRVSYLEKLMGLIGGELDRGVIHPSIWSMAARTGRMSVSEPPLQQLPSNDKTARKAFVADNDDEVMISADFGQIELRCWAILNKDQKMLDMLNEADRTGKHFFVLLGQDLYHDPNFSKEDHRYTGIKSTMYATVFAGGDDVIAETAGLPLAEVQPTINALKKTYPSLADAGQSMVTTRNQIHEIWTPNGFRFRSREYRDKRKLPNWCTQGWAATILKNSAIGCRAAGLGDFLRLAVHDELLFSVPRQDAEEVSVVIEEIMNSQIDPTEFGVAIKASPTIGRTWAELK